MSSRMAAPAGSVSMMSTSLGGGSHRPSESTVGGRFEPRYVICVDYGTTFTGVGWILTKGRAPNLSDIKIVQNWGGNTIGAKVPSVFTYSANSGQRWGYGIGDSAYVIRWTKLKLEVPSRQDALTSMKQTLLEAPLLNFGPQNSAQSEIPRHLIKTSANIVTDYLREVIFQVRLDIENTREANTLENFPIDIVITHPAVWDARAKNLTFRAVLAAFRAVFHDIKVRPNYIRLATEPEACAQYTVQAAQAEDLVTSQQLRAGECFIVVDAGGGTVDLVSYRIDQLTPEFKVTKVTTVSTGAFGATRIDSCFLNDFLPNRLSPADYKKLISLGGAKDRLLRLSLHSCSGPASRSAGCQFQTTHSPAS